MLLLIWGIVLIKSITPEQLAASGSEDGHQLAVFCWAAINLVHYPDLKWLHHSPNGGSRHKVEAGKLKAMGVKSGWPDIILPVRICGWAGLVIELKKPGRERHKDGGLELEQIEWLDHFSKQGYQCYVCYHWEEAILKIQNYLEQ